MILENAVSIYYSCIKFKNIETLKDFIMQLIQGQVTNVRETSNYWLSFWCFLYNFKEPNEIMWYSAVNIIFVTMAQYKESLMFTEY